MPRGARHGTLVVIPARYASTRLPAKALLKETGKYLIQHVWERVSRAKSADRVVIATDDERIRDAARSFGADVEMTRADHPNGTSRVAEVAARARCERIVNVQGDEPDVDPKSIDRLTALLDGAEMSTLAAPCDEAALADPARVKAVVDRDGWALYFSRAPLAGGLLHLGLYGYTRAFLAKYVKLPPAPIEKAERLEQLRALWHGHRIRVGLVRAAGFGGIDTPADYDAFVRRIAGERVDRRGAI